MKKLLIIFLLLFGLSIHDFSPDWYSYIGKRVVIRQFTEEIVGVVERIYEQDQCQAYDLVTHHCLWYERKYIILLRLNDDMIRFLACEHIDSIKELIQ